MSLLRAEGFGLSLAGLDLLRGIDLHIARGQILGVIGESGAGKSLLLRALRADMPRGSVVRGRLTVAQGAKMVPIAQDPKASLSPVRKVGAQLRHAARLSAGADLKEALDRVGLSEAVLGLYPHELSGGMAQRVAVVRAMLAGADLLLADEPSSALDGPAVQSLMRAFEGFCAAGGAALIVSHDPVPLARCACEFLVMQGGRIIERGAPKAVMAAPEQPFTRRLLADLPSNLPPFPCPPPEQAPVLEVQGLCLTRRGRRLGPVTFSLRKGEVMAVVGRSGSGKTTLARLIAGLERPDEGQVRLAGARGLAPFDGARDRHALQMVTQDGHASFPAGEPIGRSLAPSPFGRSLGLGTETLARRPDQLSQGQRARAALLRALALLPKVLILDEPTAAYDASRQRDVLERLQAERINGTAILLITHDLHLARLLAERIAVMEAGQIVELSATTAFFDQPRSGAGRALLAAITPQTSD